jgi:Xaa-Pro aminopeptidase
MLEKLSPAELTPLDEIKARITGLKNLMQERGIPISIIIQNVDLFYFTGSIQKGILIVPVDSDPLFFVERNILRATYETPFEVIPIEKEREVKEFLSKGLKVEGIIGMELDVVPVAVYERWKGLLKPSEVVDIAPLIKALRIIKSPFELRQIRESGRIVSFVFRKAKEVIKEGITELEIASILEAEGRRQGHQGFLRMRGLNQEMMCIYVTHGISATIHSAGDVPISGVGITHAIAQGPSMHTIKRGLPVLIDYGGGYNGYITDETRAFVIGELKEVFYKAYNVAREIIEETISFAKEGVNCVEIYEKAYQIVKREGLEDDFMGYGKGKVSFIGHGLGLEINELPVITAKHRTILKEGMVFAFEPKFIIPEEGAIGIEVDLIVKKDGVERVIDTPLDLVRL